MAQLFSKRADLVLRSIALAAGVLTVAALSVVWTFVRTPTITRQYVRVVQPVPFAHTLHVNALKIDCRYCHAGAERGPMAGLPPTRACVPCHDPGLVSSAPFTPVRNSLATGRAIPWRRITSVPDFVFFNHAAHVRNGVECGTCHGPVNQMKEVYQVVPLTMNWCVECHRRATEAAGRPHGASLTSCTTCHR
jgi:hypothetical protein